MAGGVGLAIGRVGGGGQSLVSESRDINHFSCFPTPIAKQKTPSVSLKLYSRAIKVVVK